MGDTINILDVELLTHCAQNFNDLNHVLIRDDKILNNNDYKRWDESYLVSYFDKRYIKRLARFSQLAIVVSERLLRNNKIKLSLTDEVLQKTGICLGNNFAGWDYVESQMADLYTIGMSSINPYVATAWFPAAAQGEISIRSKLYGHSKTFSCDALSSILAIEYGCDILKNQKLDFILAGGAESLISPIVASALDAMGLTNPNYRASEAACMFLLSNSTEFKSYASAQIIKITRSHCLENAIEKLFVDFPSTKIDYCILPPCDITDENQRMYLRDELEKLKEYLGDAYIGIPTTIFEETGGCTTALQLAVAVWSLKNQAIPAYNSDLLEGLLINNTLRINRKNTNENLNNVLIFSRDYSKSQFVFTLISKIIH